MKNAILQELSRLAERDEQTAHHRLTEAVRAARGPLRQQQPDGDYLVSFVALDHTERPALRTELLPGLEPSAWLDPVPGIAGAWCVELVVRRDIRTTYQFQDRILPFPGAEALDDPAVLQRYVRQRYRVSHADPMNPDRRPPAVIDPAALAEPTTPAPDGGAGEAVQPPIEKWDSLLELPDAPAFPWHRPIAQRGTVTRRRFDSARLGNSRDLTIWTPPGHHAAGPQLPVLLLLDGEAFADENVRAPWIFDALHAAGKVRPFIGVLVHNASETSRMTEYPCNPEFADVVVDDLLPELRARYRISSEAADVIVGGFSYSGLAANHLGLFRPDRIGGVLSLSASVWWGKRREGTGELVAASGRDDAPEWLTRNIPAAPKVVPAPRFWLDVGILEDASIPYADGASMLDSNRRFSDALQANGYRVVDYVEAPGGHDLLHWRVALADGLIALLGR
ncbi:alpha/beta hydrolase [Nakamurella lactea]|uniref:alpha/beta hydrolase n=1 Tax=Nakamurella lactea TaxID=459515 RepID=UPI00041A667B|nr:alpha/beta hydrolase-fold protein [Nakamurella lactea]